MKSELCFTIKTDYLDDKQWEDLKKLQHPNMRSKWLNIDGKKLQIWVFPIDHIHKVEEVVGKIELPKLPKAKKQKAKIVIEEVNIQGYKGTSGARIEDFIEVYKVTEHRRPKGSDEVVKSVHYIPRTNVEVFWKILTDNVAYREEISYRDLVTLLIEHYGLQNEVDLNSWAGGKNRAKHYFQKHYYVAKILEEQGKIFYGDRGEIMRAI